MQMRHDPGRKVGNALRGIGLIIRRIETVFFVTGRAQTHNKFTGDLARDGSAKVLLNEGKRHLNAGSAAGRCVEALIFQEGSGLTDAQLGKALSEITGKSPVGGYMAAVEQTARSEGINASGDRSDATHLSCLRRDPSGHAPIASPGGADLVLLE